MYATLTLFAGFIVFMFVATAASSVLNAYRENHAVRVASSQRIAF